MSNDEERLTDAQIAEVLGVPWDRLKDRHRDMARNLLHDTPVGARAKAVHWAVHLMAFHGGYRGGLRQILTRRANTLLRELAEAGDPESQCALGRNLLGGIGITKNQVEGVQWLERAVEQGYAEAAAELGSVYEYHHGPVRRDLARSRAYFDLAGRLQAKRGTTAGES